MVVEVRPMWRWWTVIGAVLAAAGATAAKGLEAAGKPELALIGWVVAAAGGVLAGTGAARKLERTASAAEQTAAPADEQTGGESR